MEPRENIPDPTNGSDVVRMSRFEAAARRVDPLAQLILIVVVALVLVVGTLLVAFTEMTEEVLVIVAGVITWAFNKLSSVFDFYYGSSTGSKRKTEMLGK